MVKLMSITRKVVWLGWVILCIGIGSNSHTFKATTVQQPYDAIIVPGVPFKDKVWSNTMKIRVHWAVHLYKKGITKNIVFSGSAVYSPYIEARIMSLYAQALGVDKAHILTEERAEHSSENLYYSYRLAKDNGLDKIALATDPFQGVFLKGFAKKIKLDSIGFLPIVFEELNQLELSTPKIEPTWAYIESFVSLVDRESLAVRFRGTMGKFIEFAPEYDPKTK